MNQSAAPVDEAALMQTRLPLTTADLAQLRFAYSPMWELILSVRLLQSSDRHVLYAGWLQAVRPALAKLDMQAITALVRPSGYFPDFLTPAPTSANPSFETELEQLTHCDPELVRSQVLKLQQLQSPDPLLDHYLKHPQQALQDLARQLQAYWQHALAAHWPRIQGVLEGDVIARGRSLALGGPARVFQELHPGVSFEGNTVILSKRSCRGQFNLNEQGLILIPSLFAWPDIYLLCDAMGQPCMCYSARGAGLWNPGEQAVPDVALAAALGTSRSLLLRAIVTPLSTTDIAQMLGHSPGAVSQQLSRLESAGLVDSHRHGRRVYYQLSGRGENLLSLFGGAKSEVKGQGGQAPSADNIGARDTGPHDSGVH